MIRREREGEGGGGEDSGKKKKSRCPRIILIRVSEDKEKKRGSRREKEKRGESEREGRLRFSPRGEGGRREKRRGRSGKKRNTKHEIFLLPWRRQDGDTGRGEGKKRRAIKKKRSTISTQNPKKGGKGRKKRREGLEWSFSSLDIKRSAKKKRGIEGGECEGGGFLDVTLDRTNGRRGGIWREEGGEEKRR